MEYNVNDNMVSSRIYSTYILYHTAKKFLFMLLPEKELRGLSPKFHIHGSVSDLYIIPTIGPPIFLQQNMQTDRGNI
jgi:hypothetical protein